MATDTWHGKSTRKCSQSTEPPTSARPPYSQQIFSISVLLPTYVGQLILSVASDRFFVVSDRQIRCRSDERKSVSVGQVGVGQVRVGHLRPIRSEQRAIAIMIREYFSLYIQ